MPSIEELEAIIAKFPDKPFPRYGLAMEYKKAKRWDDAVREFQHAMRMDPNYVAAWFQCGLALQEAGRLDEARKVLTDGLGVANRIGNAHAASEISETLHQLGG